MRPTGFLLFMAVLVLFLAPGCATDKGNHQPAQAKDNRPPTERLKIGMTKEEVRSALGNPGGESVNSDGTATWNYSDNAKMFIPFYAIGGGKFQNITINFDNEGKVKNWNVGKTGIY